MTISAVARSVLKAILPKAARDLVLRTRSLVRKSLPGRILALIRAFAYDLRRFYRHSSAISGPVSQAKLRARITIDYHRIEKGLSLPNIRTGFGEAVFHRLIDSCTGYVQSYWLDRTIAVTLNVLDNYASFRAATDGFPDHLNTGLTGLKQLAANYRAVTDEGGTLEYQPARDNHGIAEHFRNLVLSRHSIRNFTGDSVSTESISRALELAARSPSVCNRQSCGAYCYYGAEEKELLLSFQNGNTGFGHLAGAVLLVVSDLSIFTSEAERYQGWIDGGMFAMSLIYALHSAGLGTCCLNWSATVSDDLDLRKAVSIRAQDNVIMMIAVGHMPDSLRVANSPRIPLSEVLRNQPPA